MPESTSPNRADAIFAGALSRPSDLREAYMSEECGEDADLLTEVRALLAAHEAAPTGFLDDPAGEELDATIPSGGHGAGTSPPQVELRPGVTEREGDIIGPYKLLQELGEGGFGTVWMAEQSEPFTRKVALKVIKAGMDTKEVLVRFEAERQALAMMDHTNIAKVLDAGATEAGRPYFAMELVNGIAITQFCDEQGLGTRERLELFGDVCSAINHAHQKGIIHRDIKPNNVMVTLHGDKPVVKVIDFGIAKATQGKLTDKTLFTRFEQFMGTPIYMSPEQATLSGLDIDTRSDIYALGVLLYELLTGKPPFDAKSLVSAGYEEMRRIIREEEPERPSSRLSTVAGEERTALAKARQVSPEKLNRLVESDLDWIVMKAIEKDRTRRYETANAFASDIGRYLADEPVLAAAPSARYKLKKFIHRNRKAATVAASVALLLIAATGVSSYLAHAAWKAEQVASAALEEKETALASEAKERARAEENEKSARASAEAAMKANDILGSIFESLDPKEIAESGRLLQNILADKLDYAIEELEKGAISDPLVAAKMQGKLGNSLFALGEWEKAIRVLERANATLEIELGEDHPDTLGSMNNLALGYREAGQLEKALPLQEKVFELSKAKLGAEHPGTLTSMNSLAMSYMEAGQIGKALPLQEKVFELMEAKLGEEHPYTLNSINNLAMGYFKAGQLEKSLPLQKRAFELMKAKLGEDHPDTHTSMNNLAMGYQEAGQLEKALPLHEKAFDLAKAKLGAGHPETLVSMNSLAMSYMEAGQIGKALPLQEKVFELMEAKLGEEHPYTLNSMNNLAVGYQEAGQIEKALPLLEKAFELSKAKLGEDHPGTHTKMNNLAMGYEEAGQLEKSLPLQKKVFELAEGKLGADHPHTLKSMNNLAGGYMEAGQIEKARPLLEKAFELEKAKLGEDHPDTLTSMNNLAVSYMEAGQFEKALPFQKKVFELVEAKLGGEHPYTLTSMSNLAMCYEEAGQIGKARPLLEKVFELCKAKLGEDHPDTLTSMSNLAMSYKEASQFEKALPLLEKAIELSKAKLGEDHPDTLVYMGNLALGYQEAGQLEKALPLQEKVFELAEAKLGEDHPLTLKSMNNLAAGYHKAGQLEKGLPLLEKAFELSKTKLGEDHPTTLLSMGNLAAFYHEAGQPEKALRVRRLMQVPEKPAPGEPPSQLGFWLKDFVERNEKDRASLLGEPDLEFSGEDQDGETGVRYDEERSHTVKECTLDLLLLAGATRQVGLTTGSSVKFRDMESVQRILGEGVELERVEESEGVQVYRVRFKSGDEGKVYIEFDEDGETDTFKLVLPEAKVRE